MSDDRLRLLERRAAGSGDVVDRAAVLAERQRRGILPPERLALAAFCGDIASRLVVGLPLVVDRPSRASRTKGFTVVEWAGGVDNRSLSDFLHGLTFWEETVALRFATAASRSALPTWARRFGVRKRADGSEETIVDGPCGDARCCPHSSGPPACLHHERARPRLTIEAVEAWLSDMSPARLDAIRALPAAGTVRANGKRTGEAWWGGLILAALWVAEPDGCSAGLTELFRDQLTLIDDVTLGAADWSSEQTAKAAGCSAVIPWALGEA